jgi:glutamate synthase (ferredoxin)
LVENHFSFTSSKVAEEIISNWKENKNKFIKVMPTEYKAALEKMANDKIVSIIK